MKTIPEIYFYIMKIYFYIKESIRLWLYLRKRKGKCEAIMIENGITHRCGAISGFNGCFGHTLHPRWDYGDGKGIVGDGKPEEYDKTINKQFPYKMGVQLEIYEELKKDCRKYLNDILS